MTPDRLALDPVQFGVFAALLALIAGLTWWWCRGEGARGDAAGDGAERDYFLAGGGLGWVFVAGSITLTNLSTDQLVGMNGNQMALLAWWELAAVVGLLILAFVFLPIYYREDCKTTTELLERRYGDPHIRALISALFLLGNVLIFLPAVLYSGSLFMAELFGIDVPIMVLATLFAVVGAAYAIFGGLRAVAVSDTFSGVLLLAMALAVVWLALDRVGFDLSDVPRERLSMIGGPDSPIPWPTLLTGMLFIQIFYWSTNQTITQRAMASPTVWEAQKGVLVAAGIRLLIVPAIVVIPGIVAFKLYGDIDDRAYGRIAGDVLPVWMSGAFAAAMAAAVLTTFNSILNSSAALWVLDIHETYIAERPRIRPLSIAVSLVMVAVALSLVPVYATAESIINLLQQLYGLLSMPILSAFIVGLMFRGVRAGPMIAGVVTGVVFYGLVTAPFSPLTVDGEGWLGVHYIHWMLATLILCVATALAANALTGGRREVVA